MVKAPSRPTRPDTAGKAAPSAWLAAWAITCTIPVWSMTMASAIITATPADVGMAALTVRRMASPKAGGVVCRAYDVERHHDPERRQHCRRRVEQPRDSG